MRWIRPVIRNPVVLFASGSFIIFAFLAITIAYLLSSSIQDQAIDAAMDDAVDRTMIRVAEVITPADFLYPMIGERYSQFHEYVQGHIVTKRTARVKLWTPDKMVIYSSKTEQVGNTYPDNEAVAKAMNGETIVEPPKINNQKSENQQIDAPVIAIYTPLVYSGVEKVSGVLEIYEYYEPILSSINQIRYRVFTILAIGFGVLYLILVSTVSILWRRILTQQLRRRGLEKFLKTLSDSSPVGIFVIVDGKFQFVNPQFERDTGYSKEELLGRESLSLVYQEDISMIKEKAVKMLKGERVNPYEYRLINKSGETRWVMESVVSIEYDSQRAALGNYMDISSHRLAEKALKEADEKLRQSQKMEAIGRLAGGVAHDFNNLLTVITICTENLLAGIKESDPLHKDVEDIKLASDRASKLTSQLLLLSRRRVQQNETLDLNIIMVDLEKMLGRIIGENCHLETILEPNPYLINTDRGGIEQIIMNLVVNAHDAMPKVGKITLKTENLDISERDAAFISDARPGHFVRLSIEDTGIGMSKEIMEHIFEPFFTTKEKGKGTGLGLSTVYSIVKQNNGWINVYSEPGKGSRFSIYIPACNASKEENVPSTKRGAQGNVCGNGQWILVVEDEEQILNLTTRMLAQEGYKVYPAKSVKEAREAFKDESFCFQLVFSDVVLTDGSGVELVSQLLGLDPDVKIILSSGYADEKAQFSFIQEKGYPFIQKPYRVDALLRKIKEVLATKQVKQNEEPAYMKTR